MNAICIVVDRLHAGYLGAYGNTWIETPALDRLACESFLFDQFLIDSPQLERACRSYWQGRHAFCAAESLEDDRPALASFVSSKGVRTALLTDEPCVLKHPLSRTFDEIVQLEAPSRDKVAEEIDQTHLAEFFARAIQWLESAREPFLLWCHTQGLGAAWDAPLVFRRQYAEADDPLPPDSPDVPSLRLEEDFDPDRLLGISHAYAGQVSLLDVCMAALLELIEPAPFGEDTLLMFTSARGFALGEHGQVGPSDQALHGELVHVPLLWRFPDRVASSGRSPALAQPPDVWATLLEWFGLADPTPQPYSLMPVVREDTESIRDRLGVLASGGERAIRTPAWYLRDAAQAELFAKPGDRWEVNDVSDRYPELVDSLRMVLDDYQRATEAEHPVDLIPLEEVLMTGLE